MIKWRKLKKHMNCLSPKATSSLTKSTTVKFVKMSQTGLKNHIRVVLLVTYGESASCFIQLQMIWRENKFWWKILSVQNILFVFILQNYSFNELFIIFISITYKDFFPIFWLQRQIYFFSSLDWMFFSNLTFDGCKPVTHLMI